MFQSMIFVAIPALVGLTAAFYVLYKIAKEEQGPIPQRAPQREPRTVNPPGVRRRDNVRQRNRVPGPISGPCAICFEDKSHVELYPCMHKNICENCTIKIIQQRNRPCPFCRVSIQGYT
ncbi:unnamed protein product [Lymnaea stagnalis]|uniref:RING-type domain-containing protein n=1 Tax=Lymnaea stagnalis TaxID=6523 RepID=A0AAV2I2Z1_LYMST